jgi:hypothetical protein
MAVQIGDTFLFGQGSHLWVVISDPAKNNGEYVIVNLTTDVFRAGKECQLDVGDHQWVRQTSYVSYGDARKVTPKENARIQSLVSQGQVRQHFPMKQATLQKIISQAKTSNAIAADLLALL